MKSIIFFLSLLQLFASSCWSAETLHSEKLHSETLHSDKLQREAQLNKYYVESFSDQISSVRVDQKTVTVSGVKKSDSAELVLLEIRPELSIADDTQFADDELLITASDGFAQVARIDNGGSFSVKVPRFVKGRDRSTSRWGLASKQADASWKLHSHWHYANDLAEAAEAAEHKSQPLYSPSIKGMAGIVSSDPLSELVELGVHNITLNITLSSLLDTKQRGNWLPFEHADRTWYVNPRLMAEYDKVTKFAAAHDIVVSGILLINFSDSDFGKMLVHPEADRAGHYAMPNLTDANGALAYEAVLHWLASRYATVDKSHGQISNWIIHNEIGYGWEWTNMGSQPPMLYMDHYIRSMRMAHDVARRYDANARVFISLTHHWNTPADASWKTYSNRRLIDRLIEASQVEGDFAWGIAFHPYPQDLTRADTWHDSLTTDTYDTKMITLKNIAVLDRWMHEDQMRDRHGSIRGLLLSEQGFNTPDYSIENQQIQAAAFAYAWRQLRGLESVEAFHNHRLIDAAGEGGLLLGLRTLPSIDRPHGDKKLSWKIYQSLDTDAEESTCAFATNVIQ